MKNRKIKLFIVGMISSFCSYSQTVLTLQPNGTIGKDAEVGSLVPNSNYGESTKIAPYAWTQQGLLNVVRPLLQFDLTSIPQNAIITSAKLSLYYNPNYVDKEHIGNTAFWIKRITSSWDENNVTWNNQPSTTTNNQVEVASYSNPTQSFENIDVLKLVQDMLIAPNVNYGFMLQLKEEIQYSKLILASSDNIDNSAHPKLEITYEMPTSSCLILQPDAINGKDAEIGSIVPDINYGNSEKFTPYAWTQNSALNVVRPLVEFDLSDLPNNATITEASLSLYYNPNYVDKQHVGNTSMVIKRITSAWEERSVTWNTQPSTTNVNQIYIPQLTDSHQSLIDINVKNLVQDMAYDKNNSFGFMVQLENETPYSKVILSSSDNIDYSTHPKLKVCYALLTDINIQKYVENNDLVSVYPNPVSNSFQAKILNPLLNSNFKLYNSQGEIISEGVFMEENTNIDISSQIDGLYTLVVNFDETLIVKKIIKN